MNKRLQEVKENVTNIADHAICMTKFDYDWLIEQVQNSNLEIDDWKQSHDKVARALEKSECEHLETMNLLHDTNNMRTEVKWFAEQMESKLQENDHKGGWQDCDCYWLLNRAIKECVELSRELDAHRDLGDNKEKIIKECSDVANFVMMIADKVRKN
ncbi:hypothetical protein OCE50_27885 [Bacillus wiedmannii]|uniref:hypothetical protein n=1 Tax=Bacillus cereus group TaxID=86661 RepID=UPI002106E964|nr:MULTISPECIES: hypothetical protein [Bacillus cereus group]MCU5414689.1 hypothetical protein [Bacillus wiedmannii]